ncbi:hypothetical protein SD436_05320 [Streptococcus sp. 2A/TPW/M5]
MKGVQNHFFMVMGESNGGIQGHQDSVVAGEIGKVTFSTSTVAVERRKSKVRSG